MRRVRSSKSFSMLAALPSAFSLSAILACTIRSHAAIWGQVDACLGMNCPVRVLDEIGKVTGSW